MAQNSCVLFMGDGPKFMLGDGPKFMCVIRGKRPNVHVCYSWEMALNIDGAASFDNPQAGKEYGGLWRK
jgi:hypothetical protein